MPILRVAGTPPGILRGSSSPHGHVQPAEPRTHAASGSRYRRKGAYRSGPFHRGQRRTDHRLDDEPSSASRAVASPSPSIAARQPRSAQSCCATAPAATGRVEVVVLAVISILLFALSFRTCTGLFRRRTHCAAANGTCLSANRSAQGMNSTSSDWGTSGGQPVSGRLATIGM